MNTHLSLFFLYSITLTVIGFLLYNIVNKSKKVKVSQVMNELSTPQRFETHWWGYGWRPWWRRYNGVPGLGPAKPLPTPKMPKPGKPVIINTNPVLY